MADTGALLALIDRDDRHHAALVEVYQRDPEGWVLPWATLPEIDYLLLRHVGIAAELAFVRDLAEGRWVVDWNGEADLAKARDLCQRHRALGLGLVDAAVIVTAERLGASAIATLDLRHFGALRIRGVPRLLPRDL